MILEVVCKICKHTKNLVVCLVLYFTHQSEQCRLRSCFLLYIACLKQVFGDRIGNFVTNFETSFRSTLKTLRLISNSSQIDEEQLQRARSRGCSCSTEGESLPHRNITEQQKRAGYQESSFEPITFSSHDKTEDSRSPSIDTQSQMEENMKIKPLGQQIVLHGQQIEQQLACASPSTSSSKLSIIEKALVEQTRSNDLQTVKINLSMKKLELKERQLELSSTANLLDRWKLSMGFSKACFKEEKFKTQLQETRQMELLKSCLDLLVAGLIVMLFALAYGAYIYSHRKLIEATEACSPYTVQIIL